MIEGTIFDIKRFAVHDGPGIRTTVFVKGCPLSCLWCHNPEGQSKQISLWYFQKKCIHCKACIPSCPKEALKDGGDTILIDRNLCDNCGRCVTVCPARALEFDGKVLSVQEVVTELKKDALFYETSNGGITLSGGEVLHQPEFSLEILKECKMLGFHTAVETCLYADTSVVAEVFQYVDYAMIDMKLYDASWHKAYTGVDNTRIKRNLSYLIEHFTVENMLIRIPLIPCFTSDRDNINSIIRFLFSLHIDMHIEFINYNPLAPSKYQLMQREFLQGKRITPHSDAEVASYYEQMENMREQLRICM